jgi:hypothetical protein
MTTKDYVYLGLIALAALIFYCHGFYAGIIRSRRIYDALLGDCGTVEDPGSNEAGAEEIHSLPPPSRHQIPSFPIRELRGDFGNN